MKTLVRFVFLLATVSAAGAAQTPRSKPIGTTNEQVARQTISNLFQGIAVSPDQRHAADSIALHAIDAMTALGPSPDRAEKVKKIRGDRDFDLRALLLADSDKARFDANVAKASAASSSPVGKP